MARVVQKSGVPYLTIIFAFLFLVSAVVAVLMYLEVGERQEELDGLQEKNSRLATDEQWKRNPVIRAMADSKKDRNTVVAQFLKREELLTEIITGSATDPKDAEEKAERAFAVMSERRGLAEEVVNLDDQVKSKDQRIGDLQKESKKYLSEKQQASDTAKQIEAKLAAEIETLKKQINDLDVKLADAQKAHEKQMDGAKGEWKDIREEKDQKIAALNKTSDELNLAIQQWRTKYDLLLEKYQQKIAELFEGLTPEMKPDGRIVRLVDGENICYINLGSKDGVRPDVTFSVYGPEGVPTGGKSKAKIVITNVSDTISECRISEQDKENPILVDDSVVNVVFNILGKLTFLVEGNFDLRGTGAGAAGAEEVKALIRRFGGKVGEELSIDTNFLVMGEPPMLPREPSPDAPPNVWEVYREQMKAYNRYHDIQRLARDMRIPVLNTQRFIELTGYVLPTETASR